MDFNDLVKLGVMAANGQPTVTFSNETFTQSQVNTLFREQLNELAGDYKDYRENKTKVFALIERIVDEILPPKVLDQFEQFAEIQTIPQGDRAIFKMRITEASKRRAKKQFVTRVTLAGVYEVFKLDGATLEVQAMAFGGAAQIGLEEFLDGRFNFADFVDVVLEGLEEKIYLEIEKALSATISKLPAANQEVHNSFDEKAMDRLLATVDTYGQSAIYCTFEFAATMVPAQGWVSNEMKNRRWEQGYLGDYKGHKVIVLPQSFEDETNAQKVIDPSKCWIIPAGSEKIVKIVFEGETQTREIENEDWSKEIQIYKKVGVAVFMVNNIGSYINTSLKKENV